MKRRMVVSRSEAETEAFAARFARTLCGGEALLLTGELGAGKTAFVRGLALGLGVRERITSPTFVLMRVHHASGQRSTVSDRHRRRSRIAGRRPRYLVHVDAYRIRDPRELADIGLLEWVGRPDTIVAIEWGERARRILRSIPQLTIHCTPDPRYPDRRRITIVRPPADRKRSSPHRSA